MPTFTVQFDYTTEAERIALEQTIAYLTQLQHTGRDAAPGTVLDACEQITLADGRDALKANLEAALQTRAQANDAAKKMSPVHATKDNTNAGS